jgi:transposase
MSYIGIDISKPQLDVANYNTGEITAYPNTPTGIDALTKYLQSQSPDLIACEPTGGYEIDVLIALSSANLPIVLVNARQIRNFAKATNTHAKTDTIDAMKIAHFASAIKPEPRALPDLKARELGNLVSRRAQIATIDLGRKCLKSGKLKW